MSVPLRRCAPWVPPSPPFAPRPRREFFCRLTIVAGCGTCAPRGAHRDDRPQAAAAADVQLRRRSRGRGVRGRARSPSRKTTPPAPSRGSDTFWTRRPLKEGEPPAETARKLDRRRRRLPACESAGRRSHRRRRRRCGAATPSSSTSARPDDRLRGADCRANVFHIAPSRAMLTDALAQFLAFKRWRKLFLIVGPKPGDKLYAEAMKRSARKFGLTIARREDLGFRPARPDQGRQPRAGGRARLHPRRRLRRGGRRRRGRGFRRLHPLPDVGPAPGRRHAGARAASWHPTHEAGGGAAAEPLPSRRRSAPCARSTTRPGWRFARSARP